MMIAATTVFMANLHTPVGCTPGASTIGDVVSGHCGLRCRAPIEIRLAGSAAVGTAAGPGPARKLAITASAVGSRVRILVKIRKTQRLAHGVVLGSGDVYLRPMDDPQLRRGTTVVCAIYHCRFTAR